MRHSKYTQMHLQLPQYIQTDLSAFPAQRKNQKKNKSARTNTRNNNWKGL